MIDLQNLDSFLIDSFFLRFCFIKPQKKNLLRTSQGSNVLEAVLIILIYNAQKTKLKLMLLVRTPITFIEESSIISKCSNIAESIIRKIINVKQENNRTKSGTFRSLSINKILLQGLFIQNHTKQPITEKLRISLKT